MCAQVLRRSQFALKDPAAEEGEGKDETGEGEKKGRGRPKAKAKGKAKAKAKAKGAAKGRAKSKAKASKKVDQNGYEGDSKDAAPEEKSMANEVPCEKENEKTEEQKEEIEKEKEKIVESDGKEGEEDLKKGVSRMSRLKSTAALEPAVGKEPTVPKVTTRTSRKRQAEGVESGGSTGDGQGQAKRGRKPPPGVEAASFARRPKPSSEFPAAKWRAIKDAFVKDIKPMVKYHSSHEASMMGNRAPPAAIRNAFLNCFQNGFPLALP